MGMGKFGAVAMALAALGGVAGEVVQKTERVFLNLPMSMLLVAVAGTMIGFFILPAKEAARVNPPIDAPAWKRIMYYAFSLALVALAMFAYAVVAGWCVQAGMGIIRSIFQGWKIEESVVIPVTGLVGVGIRPWLPSLLKAVERRADRVIGGAE